MGKLEQLEKQIQELSDKELAEFRQWYAEFDANAWDVEIESDVRAGKLDEMAEKALTEHRAGRSSPL
jgi:hypothetical protein